MKNVPSFHCLVIPLPSHAELDSASVPLRVYKARKAMLSCETTKEIPDRARNDEE